MRATTFLCLFALLTSTLLPPAVSAQTEDEPVPPWQDVPTPPRTGVLAVDERLRSATEVVNEYGRIVYEPVGDGANEIAGQDPPSPLLRVFQDGFGDGRSGGFGEWTDLDADLWHPDTQAARSGTSGYTLSDGPYPQRSRALLLSPELDLRTGMRENDVRGGAGDGSDEVQGSGDGIWDILKDVFESAWETIRGEVDDPLAEALLDGYEDETSFPDRPGRVPVSTELPEGWSPYRFDLDMRYNLQAAYDESGNMVTGRDGFQFWLFTERPTEMPESCMLPGCRIVEPVRDIGVRLNDEGSPIVVDAPITYRYDDNDTVAFDGPAMTGYSDWQTLSLDLVNHADQSVWVGIMFASTGCLPGCESSPSRFNTDAGFYGIQVDDAVAEIPAPTHSIRMRPLIEPSVIPPGRDTVTVNPDLDLPVITEVGNLGHLDQTVTFNISIDDGSHLVAFQNLTRTMTSGESGRLTSTFPAGTLDVGKSYRLNVTASTGGPDADDRDNSLQEDLYTEPIQAAQVTRIRPVDAPGGAPSRELNAGEPLWYEAIIKNVGNTPLSIQATGTVVRITDHATLGVPEAKTQKLLGGPETKALAPLESGTIVWGVDTSEQGQYELEVTLKDPEGEILHVFQGGAVGISRSLPPILYDADPNKGLEPEVGGLFWLDVDDDGTYSADDFVYLEPASALDSSPGTHDLRLTPSAGFATHPTIDDWDTVGVTQNGGPRFLGFRDLDDNGTLDAGEPLYLTTDLLISNDVDCAASPYGSGRATLTVGDLNVMAGHQIQLTDITELGQEIKDLPCAEISFIDDQNDGFTLQDTLYIDIDGDNTLDAGDIRLEDGTRIDTPPDPEVNLTTLWGGDTGAVLWLDVDGGREYGVGDRVYLNRDETESEVSPFDIRLTRDGDLDFAARVRPGDPDMALHTGTLSVPRHFAFLDTDADFQLDPDEAVYLTAAAPPAVPSACPILETMPSDAASSPLDLRIAPVAEDMAGSKILEGDPDDGQQLTYLPCAAISFEDLTGDGHSADDPLYLDVVGDGDLDPGDIRLADGHRLEEGGGQVQRLLDGSTGSVLWLNGDAAARYSAGDIVYIHTKPSGDEIAPLDVRLTPMGPFPFTSRVDLTDPDRMVSTSKDDVPDDLAFIDEDGDGELDPEEAVLLTAASFRSTISQCPSPHSIDAGMSHPLDIRLTAPDAGSKIGLSRAITHLPCAEIVYYDQGNAGFSPGDLLFIDLDGDGVLEPGDVDLSHGGRLDGTGPSVETLWNPLGLEEGVPDWKTSDPFRLYGAEQGWFRGGFTPRPDVLFYMGVDDPDDPYVKYELKKYIHNRGWSQQPPASLTSPPVFIDADTPAPYLVFEHQFATNAVIIDCPSGGHDLDCGQGGPMAVRSVVWVEGRVGEVTKTGTQWGPWTFLQSEGTPVMDEGAAEEVLNIQDPLYPNPAGRTFYRNFCSGKIYGEHASCGWWWPSGQNPKFLNPGDEYPTGKDFGEGSPWLTERIPLSEALHGETEEISFDARGKEFQFRFLMPHKDKTSINTGDGHGQSGDPGWRIGSVAVQREQAGIQDAAITAIEPDLPYDPARIGLGPEQEARFTVTVQNDGRQALEDLTVWLTLHEVEDGRTHEASATTGPGTSIDEPLESGDSIQVTSRIPIPEAGLYRVRAHVVLPGQSDDYPANNERWDQEIYPARVHKDVTIRTDIPPTLEPGARLSTPITVENLGNVPIEANALTISREIQWSRGTGIYRSLSDAEAMWRLNQPISPGERVDLGTTGLPLQRLEDGAPVLEEEGEPVERPLGPADDVRLAAEGDYVLRTEVELAGDQDVSDNEAVVQFQALPLLYKNLFRGPASQADDIVSGSPQWSADFWDVSDGSLRAGDPETGEIPPDSDASYVLPPMDLTTLRGATLNLRHDYALEEGYDAARVEIRGEGTEWVPLEPEPDPLHGLPEGYPEGPLIGISPLAPDTVAPRSSAFTGRSGDLPNSEDGSILTTFDLGRSPVLRRATVIDEFPLSGLPPEAMLEKSSRLSDEDQWWNPDWTLDEPHAEARERHWWIGDNTYQNPEPRGKNMWWSGTAGTDPEQPPVDTQITYTVNLGPLDEDGRLNVTWWDWRDGWETTWRHRGHLFLREGSGGAYKVILDDVRHHYDPNKFGSQNYDGSLNDQEILQTEPDGWTQRRVLEGLDDLSDGLIDITFQWVGSRFDEANRGWFLDGLEVSYESPDGQTFPLEPAFKEITRKADTEEQRYQDVTWSCVGKGERQELGCEPEPGSLRRPVGWHVGPVLLPDGGQGNAWRFSSDAEEGYPAGSDARLVTPVVDLTVVKGDQATLRFDHRFDFYAQKGCQAYPAGTINPPRCAPSPALEPPLVALDGGVVEIQVLNETSGRFDPWQVVIDRTPPWVGMGMDRNGGAGSSVTINDHSPASRDTLRFYQMGYPAVMDLATGNGLTRLDVETVRCCTYQMPFAVTPVFSGQQEWQHKTFDVSPFIGKKVRFAFHTWTDSVVSDPDRLGWELANVGVDADAFVGEPVEIRFRTTTDGSLTKGEWNIDEVTLVGKRYARNVVVEMDHTAPTSVPGEPVRLTGNVSNKGVIARTGLAMEVSARDLDGDPVEVQVAGWPMFGLDEDNTGSEFLRGRTLYGPFDLTPGGSEGSVQNFTIVTEEAPDPTTIQVALRLYEDLGEDTYVGDTFVDVTDYQAPDDDSPGTTRADVPVTIEVTKKLVLVPPVPGQDALLSASPTTLSVDRSVALAGLARNQGNVQQTAEIRIAIYDRSLPATADPIMQSTRSAALDPGQELLVEEDWTPEEPGVYRAELRLRSAGETLAQAIQDVAVDTPLVFFETNMTNDDGWTFGVNSHPDLQGNPQPDVNDQWRVTGDRLLWGVHPDELRSDNHYCMQDGTPLCPVAARGGQSTGPEAWADTDVIDLTSPPGDTARLVMTHAWAFEKDTGGVVKVTAYDDAGDPVCVDENDNPIWFRIEPQGGYPGHIASGDRHQNPLGSIPAFTDRPPANRITTSIFDLQDQNLTEQLADRGDDCQVLGGKGGLIGHHIALRLHVGVQPLTRVAGDVGWHVFHMALGAAALRLEPQADEPPDLRDRTLPIQTGARKRYHLQVTNEGPLEEEIRFDINETQSGVPPHWFDLPAMVPLAPGESRLVPYEVFIPPEDDPGNGDFGAILEAASGIAPGVHDSTFNVLRLDAIPLPDLDLRLDIDHDVSEPAPPGSPVTVQAIVRNSGLMASDSVTVRFVMEPENGIPQVIDEAPLEALCPIKQYCEGAPQSQTVVSTEWITPEARGNYTVSAIIDPVGRLIEERLDNNRDSIDIRIEPASRPDVAVVDLTLSGIADDGYAEEGSFVMINATVENVGTAVASGVILNLIVGGARLSERSWPSLAPGEEQGLSIIKAFPVGDHQVEARSVTIESSDINTLNDHVSRLLRVRGHDLNLSLVDPPGPIPPGGTVRAVLEITNDAGAPERVRLTVEGAPESWRTATYPDPLVVLPGATVRSFVTLTVPSDAPTGSTLVGLVAAPETAPNMAVHEDLVVQIIPEPVRLDMQVLQVRLDRTTVTVDLALENLGNTALKASVQAVDGEVADAEVPASGTTYVRVTKVLDRLGPEGVTRLPVTADLDDGQRITRMAEFAVPPVPILEARWSDSWGVHATEAGTVPLAAWPLDITNIGNVPADIRFDLEGLPQAQADPSTLTVPAGETAGTTVQGILVDPAEDAHIRLTDMTTGVPLGRVDLPATPALPNLQVAALSVDDGPLEEGDNVRVTARVRNDGDGASARTYLLVYRNAHLVAAIPTPPMPPGEEVDLSTELQVTEGTNIIIAVADGNTRSLETKKVDNGATRIVEAAAESGLLAIPSLTPMVLPALLAAALWIRRRKE